jgi:amino acid transporter
LLVLLSGFSVFPRASCDTTSFKTAYLGIPVFAALFFGPKMIKRRNDAWCYPVMTIDLVTGLAEITAEEEDAPKKSGKR